MVKIIVTVGIVPTVTGTTLMALSQADRRRVWDAVSGFPTTRWSGVESRF